MIRRFIPRDVIELVHWYERYISPLALLSGFLLDNLVLLRRVDVWGSNILLLSYLFVAALGIVAVNMIESGRVQNKYVLNSAPIIPLIMQFAFGGLFSGYLSLYSRSASLQLSFIFVFSLALLLVANERFTRLYTRFRFQMSLYFFVLFSFLIFFLPVVIHRIGPPVFLTSGVMSIGFIALFMFGMSYIIPEIVRRNRMRIVRNVIVMFALFCFCYFTNIIPPLPLALKDTGVYHSIIRATDGNYTVTSEPKPWYQNLLRYNSLYRSFDSEPTYVYTAIFAPSGLGTTILHEWQYYSTSTSKWLTTDTLSFHIVGGRDGGYRGYSLKSGLASGDWRVNVITDYKQIIGRVTFTVIATSSEPGLITETK